MTGQYLFLVVVLSYKTMKITKESKLDKILEIEGAEEILSSYEVPCLSCPCARYELSELDIGFVCEKYGIDCEKILEDINKLVSEKGE